jgi:hypothetical protein
MLDRVSPRLGEVSARSSCTVALVYTVNVFTVYLFIYIFFFINILKHGEVGLRT